MSGIGTIAAMSAVDANHAWAVSGGVLRTQDGGATWVKVSDLNGFRIQFVDTSHGWMVSSNEVLSSADGGETWTIRKGPPASQYGWAAMSFISPTTGWISSYDGDEFFRTTDGGGTWTELELPEGSFTPGLKFISAQAGWISRLNGIFTTNDGGATWLERFHIDSVTGYEMASIVDAVSPTIAWGIVSDSEGTRTLIRTANGGATWQTTPVSLDGLDFVSATTGWATNFDVGVLQSSDGGATWDARDLPSIDGGPFVYEAPTGLAFVNATTGWVHGIYGNSLGGWKGFIMKTTTGGQ